MVNEKYPAFPLSTQTAFSISQLRFSYPTNPNPNAMLHPSGIWNGYAGASPLSCVQISQVLGNIGPVGLVKRQQRVTAGVIRQGGDGQMRASKAFCAVDSEGLTGGDGGVFSCPGDVIAADAEICILRVEVVCVTH